VRLEHPPVAAPARDAASDGQIWDPDCSVQGLLHCRVHSAALTTSPTL
jgi:hypothetical protein